MESHEHFWTASAAVDRPRASAVLIHDGRLSGDQLEPLLDRARAAGINAAVFSIRDGSRAFRQAGLEAVFEARRTLLADADLVLLSTRDAAGLYALLSLKGNRDDHTISTRDHDYLLDGTRLVVASGVTRPVGHVFAALIERVLGAASVVLLAYQPDPGPAWQTSLADLTRLQRGNVSSSPMNPSARSLFHTPQDSELGWWRTRVVGVWHYAIGSGVSLPALNAILVLPVIAFFLVIGRNLIGLETFGFFAPMLLALAFLSTGLGWGLLIFGAIIGIGGGLRVALQGLRLHLVARGGHSDCSRGGEHGRPEPGRCSAGHRGAAPGRNFPHRHPRQHDRELQQYPAGARHPGGAAAERQYPAGGPGVVRLY